MLVILGTILIVQGVRKIPLNTAKRVVGARAVDAQGARSYLPIKVNASGVMPIIFAQAIMTIPVMLFSGKGAETGYIQRALSDVYGVGYNTLLAVLIIVFTDVGYVKKYKYFLYKSFIYKHWLCFYVVEIIINSN